ncbi:MAG: hypothetical protein KDD06_15005 [Phaeodactylibacter sp.]|nr:hypothetical protein [Phaeodactylibacter sp.]MCB9287506.1 hypothetical protein [Lewinellaceae bacterium]
MRAHRLQVFPILFLVLALSIAHAQPGRWQWGAGTSVHLSNPELQTAPAATSSPVLGSGLSLLARYRLNRKANWRWGPFRNRLNLFWETGLRTDMLAYSYQAGELVVTRNYLSLETPLNLVLVSDVRSFPGWRRRKLHGYGRLGGSIGLAFPQKINESFNEWAEATGIGGLRAAVHLSSGLLRKRENGSHSSVGIFARIGLTPVVQGALSTPQMEPPVSFWSGGSLVGLEWSYFPGKPKNKVRLPEEPVDMILCPRF